ncbi:DNA cytosine methyltransferase [Saccharopolyspora flava]|uniref:DNA (cytosine-5-)-methyltransferase n=1 Tax=Saccharopolyspora flava TaxID=95161 RepID=A0A1I6QT52_9PSEU|nr:DNA cytosine methyltransferase [Saccharopolyspora flava]SFS55707.1 DNA (cytosine-5)-methyltransferase 1 [Saccharopolyspora flava]
MSDASESKQQEQGRVVDLFAGPGGLDVAATWLGLDVDGIEWDADACATRREAGLSTFQGDVREWGPKDFPEATILTGGPPCQTYTVAGSGAGRAALDEVLGFADRMAAGDAKVQDDIRRASRDHDERTGLVLEPLRWALEAYEAGAPYKKIVLEQVPAVRHVWKKYREILKGLGYKAECGVVNTEEFGVPQTRRRALLIASFDSEVEIPSPTHQRYRKGVPRAKGVDAEGIYPWVSMADAFRRSKLPSRGRFEVVSNYGTGGDPKLRGRRTSEQPSATITGKVRRNRLVTEGSDEFDRFSYPEAGLLQTFPSDFPWSGGDIGQQIGNAVPPRLAVYALAEVLGLEVKSNDVDAAVEGEWEKTRESKPLANSSPKKRAPSDLALFDA